LAVFAPNFLAGFAYQAQSTLSLSQARENWPLSREKAFHE
jgi:hypothetical protein